MYLDIGTLRGFIQIDDKGSASLSAFRNNLSTTSKAVDSFSANIAKAGLAMSATFTAPLVAMTAVALQAGVDYTRTMNVLQATTDATVEDLNRMKAAAIEWGIKTVFSANEAGQAMLQLGKAGFTVSQSIATLPNVLNLAAAAGMGMSDAAQMTAVVMKTFALNTGDLAHANDIMAMAANSSTLTLGDLREAYKFVGTVAHQAGFSLAETTAAMDLMAEAGIKGEMGGTSLRKALETLMAPTKKQADLMKEMGLNGVYANGKLADLATVVGRIQASGADASQILELFGQRAGPAMAALVEKGSAALLDMQIRLEGSYGAAEKMAQAAMKDLPGALENMHGSIETAQMSLMTALAPALEMGVSAITTLANRVTDTLLPAFMAMPPAFQMGASGVLALTAAIGPALLGIAGLAKAASAISSGWMTVSGVFTAVGNTIPILTARVWLMEAGGGALALTLGGLASAVTLVGAAFAGWNIGVWISDITGLSNQTEFYSLKLQRLMGLIDTSATDADLWGSVMADAGRRAAGGGTVAEQAVVKFKDTMAKALATEDVKAFSDQVQALLSSGTLTTGQMDAVMQRLALHATELQNTGSTLTPTLVAIVNWAKGLGPAIDQGAQGVAGLTAQLKEAKDQIAHLSATDLSSLTTAIQSHAFKPDELEAAAGKVGLGTVALKLLEQQITATAAATKKADSDYAKSEKTFLSITSAAGAYYDTLDTLDGSVVEGVKYYKSLGDTVEELAKFYGLTKTQVNAIVESMKVEALVVTATGKAYADLSTHLADVEKAQRTLDNKAFSTNLGAETAAMKESLDIQNKLSMDSYTYQLQLIKQEGTDKQAALDVTGADYQFAFDAIETLTGQKMNAASREYALAMHDMQANTFSFVTTITGWFNQIPGIIEKALTGGGGFSGGLKALGASIGSDLGGQIGGFLNRNLNNTLVNTFGVGGAEKAGSLISSVASAGMTLGISAGIQGGIALYNKLHKTEAEKLGEDIGRDFGIGMTAANKDAFAKMTKDMEGDAKAFGRQAAELLNLDQIINFAGGLDPKNLDFYTAKLHDVFSLVQTGALTAAQATDILDKNFASFVVVATDGTGRVSGGLKTIVALTQQFGVDSKAVSDWMKGQGADAITGFVAVSADIAAPYDQLYDRLLSNRDALTKLADDGKTGTADWTQAQKDLNDTLALGSSLAITGTQDLTDLGIQAVAAYTAAVAAGMSEADALKQISPALTDLTQAYQALGLDIDNAALRSLLFANTITSQNPQLMAAIGGLSQEMIALDNLGLLNTDTFAAMERTGATMYARLQGAAAAAGGSTRDALVPMQDWLHAAAKEAEMLGVPLDDNTQILIDQSKELGIWKDTGEDAQKTLIGGMSTLVDKVSDLIDKLSHIPDVDFNINGHYNAPAIPGSGGNSNDQAGQFHTGTGEVGMTAAVSRMVPMAGVPFIGRAHTGLASDEILSILQTGESVLNRTATKRVGSDTVRALNNGGSIGHGGDATTLADIKRELAMTRSLTERMGAYFYSGDFAHDNAESHTDVRQRQGTR